MFYTAEEAAERLGRTEEELKNLVREGTLREFRDAGKINYKVDEIDALAAVSAPPDESEGTASGGSTTGEVILEPVEDSGVELSPSASDVLRLEDAAEGGLGDTGGTAAGTKATEKKLGSSAVPSVGVNVFDDDELDEAVDPLAQTAVTDVAGLGMEGTGSGSGILDLTRESDDTSRGAELLEEIYSGEEDKSGSDAEVSDDTRAGVDAAVAEEGAPAEAEVFEPEAEEDEKEEAAPVGRVITRVEYGPDALSTGLTAAMIVAVVVMWFAGLAGAGLARGIVPGILKAVYANLMIYAGGALGVAVIAAVVTFLMVKRSTGK